MKVQVINLDTQKERWVKSSARLKEMGFDPVRFPAIDPTKVDTSKWTIGTASRGVAGCAMSHLTILRQWIENPTNTEDYILVAEDDMYPLKNSRDLLEILRYLPKDAGIVHLGCATGCNDTFLQKIPLLLDSVTGSKTYSAGWVNPHFFKTTVMSGTDFYLVTRHGAEKIIKEIGYQADGHIDMKFAQIPDLVIYAIQPAFSTTDLAALCSDSNIVNTPSAVWCWLDNIKVADNRTLGYAMFCEMSNGLRPIDILLSAVAGIFVSRILRKSFWPVWLLSFSLGILVLRERQLLHNRRSWEKA
jgi:GR25 family glycosyltransferase involved in LPS biosynthesis